MRFLINLCLHCLLFAHTAAATWNSDGSDSDTQTQINNASSGDTVILPSGGAFYWDTEVTVPNTKWIYLNGNGSTIYRTNNAVDELLTTFANASGGTHVFGFIFDNVAVDQTGSSTYQVRFDCGKGDAVTHYYNNTNRTTLSGERLLRITVTDATYAKALIYNCAFIGDGNSEIVHYWGAASTSAAGWTNTITPGGNDMVFIEDCYFAKYDQSTPTFSACAAIQNYYGARLVFRHNTMDYCHVDVHGTAGEIGGRWWEIYNNTFNEPATGNQSDAIALRAGSGVVFSNVINKLGAGAMGIKLQEEDSGTCPLIYQIGRGKSSVNPPLVGTDHEDDPAYFWANVDDVGGDATPGTFGGDGDACIILDESYFVTNKPSYTPYTYPHPLRVDGGGAASGSGKGRGQLGTAGRFRMR